MANLWRFCSGQKRAFLRSSVNVENIQKNIYLCGWVPAVKQSEGWFGGGGYDLVVGRGGELAFPGGVSGEDAGEYRCSAANGRGRVVRKKTPGKVVIGTSPDSIQLDSSRVKAVFCRLDSTGGKISRLDSF